MRELEYPFDSQWILKAQRKIKRKLTEGQTSFLNKRIAVLGGSTTSGIVDILDLFLLNQGIQCEFYQSDYNKYWEDVMFGNDELAQFKPDLVYIHTSSRNILKYPTLKDSPAQVDQLLDETFEHFRQMWDKIPVTFGCPVIQNNFEFPFYRLLGNQDVADIHGRRNFVERLNAKLYGYAQTHSNFYINDIQYIAACYGLQSWSDPYYWNMYKYAMSVPAIPEFAYNLANIVKSLFGRNKKALVMDLDNTLWGGVIGDDGKENIEIGHENGRAETFTEFQEYLKAHKSLGVLLAINSKNERDIAMEGLRRPDSVLREEDFVAIRANWNPKDQNLVDIARELNIGIDSLVFVDDNPAERHIVKEQFPDTGVPEMTSPETYITTLDRCGFFEVTNLSSDDLVRSEMYAAEAKRKEQQSAFQNYDEYLLSLDMQAEIKPFSEMHVNRIAQLTNKSNQFNLTTLRCTTSDIQRFADDENYITLYGRLKDRFGDNGLISVFSGHIEQTTLHIDLWLMSCRVLKRNMEYAMMDAVVGECRQRGLSGIYGYYYPTAKNMMVKEHYKTLGFELVSEDDNGGTKWYFAVPDDYENKNKVIKVGDYND